MPQAQTSDINLNEILRQVAREKDIDLDRWIAALEDAMASAAKKQHRIKEPVRSRLDRESGRFEAFIVKKVVAEVEDPLAEWTVEEAQDHRPGAQVGDEVVQATTGSYVFKPRGLPHTFWNATTQPARLLELISPAGFERYFAELADLLRAGADVDQITKLAEKYGMELRMDWVPELCAKHKLKLVGE